MEFKDYYKILGVSKDASDDEIKREYRKLARKFHPDVSKEPDADKRFKEIGEAYEVLKDPEKRKLYDQYGSNWKEGKQQEEYRKQHQQQYQGADPGQGGFEFGGFESGEFSDFFESLFGSGRRRGHSRSYQDFQQKGDDINASIQIPIMDAYNGATRGISFNRPIVSPEGHMENKQVNLNVKIPKGIKDGQKIRLAGQGGPGYNGGEAGDMYIEIGFEKHPYLSVDGADVYFELPVAPWEAAMGGTVIIPAPSGKIKVKIPKGSTQGHKLRIKGKGIPAKTPGDLYVVLNITLPPADTDAAKKVYEQMSELDFDPRKNL